MGWLGAADADFQEFFFSAVQEGFDGTHRQVHGLGDGLIGLLFEVEKADDLAVFRGQLLEKIGEVEGDRGVWTGCFVGEIFEIRGSRNGFEGDGVLVRFFFQFGEKSVSGNHKDPGRELGFLGEMRKAFPDSKEGFLGHVFSEGGVVTVAEAKAINFVFELVENCFKGLVEIFPMEKLKENGFFIQGFGFRGSEGRRGGFLMMEDQAPWRKDQLRASKDP